VDGLSSFRVIRPGLQTTIQDAGRWGWQSRGVPVSGAMDQPSYRIANALAGNPAGAAVLEVVFVGPELEFEDSRVVAVAGAQFVVTVDGNPKAVHSAFEVPARARLRFGERAHGSRAYVAVAGGIDVPKILGSRSTHLASRMGGIGGRALTAGDLVPLGVSARKVRIGVEVSSLIRGEVRLNREVRRKADATDREIRLKPDTPTRIRMIPDARLDRFVEGTLDVLQSAPYIVGHQSDRMGFRLEGPVLHHTRGADILSDVTPIGTLQVPASGQPILLMADRQTTGGYTRIGTVIGADLPIAGQLGPGDRIAFEICSLGEARAALLAQERAVAAIEELARQ
jgi:antagonist of KipI